MPASSIVCNNIYGKPRAIDDTVVVGVADNLGRQPAQAIDLVGSTARDGCFAKVGDAFKNRIQLQGF